MLRIGITHTRFAYTGGIEKYIYSLVERLLAAGHEVHYLAARWEPYDHPRLKFHRIRWLRFPPSLRVLSFDFLANRVLARHRFDLVHGFTKTSRQDIYTDGSGTLREYVRATFAHAPSWRRRLHLLTLHQWAIARMERLRFRRDAIRRIIPMADFVREQILAEYPVDPERVVVLYNGVETEVFHPKHRETLGPVFRSRHGIPANATLLLFVGNDWGRKGLDTTLRALPEIAAGHRGEIRLAVAGHDNHPDRFRRLAVDRGVADRVTWLGAVREIREAYAAADALLFPSRYDVFGNVGLEALASGVPAVLSARAGVGELLLPENAGDSTGAGARLEDPESAPELARKTLEVLDERHADRRRQARQLAERYSWDHHFERLLQIYEDVLVEKRGQAAAAPGS